MIPLNDEQRELLHEVTHDLMLLATITSDAGNAIICDVLGVLYGGVLLATKEEAEAASARAQLALEQQLASSKAEGALH